MTVLAAPFSTLSDPITATLSERSLAQRLGDEGALEPAAAERMLRDVGDALGDLHRAGRGHGGVGPDAVWLDGQGRGRLADVPPPGAVATPADDQYALAATLAAALVGRLVAGGEAPATVVADRVPERLRVVIARASSQDPGDRFPDIAAFVAAYDQAVAATVNALGHAVAEAVLARDWVTARALRAVGLGLRPEDRTLLDLETRIDAVAPAPTRPFRDLDAVNAEALLDINTFLGPPASAKPAPSPWMPLAIAVGVVAIALLVAVAFVIGNR